MENAASRGPDGDWQISELQRRGNSGISDLARRLVQSWLDEHALSASSGALSLTPPTIPQPPPAQRSAR